MFLSLAQDVPLLPQWCEGLEDETKPEDVLIQRRLCDGRLLCVMPRDRGVTLAIGMPYPFHRIGIFQESWDYLNVTMGYYAFNSWDPFTDKEPLGWTRHAATGRYRIDGNPDQQYVKVHGDILDQVTHALMVTMEPDLQIHAIDHEPIRFSSAFPAGVECFLAYSVSSTCRHMPPCQWCFTVFHYMDRCVVLSMREMCLFDQQLLLHCLTYDR